VIATDDWRLTTIDWTTDGDGKTTTRLDVAGHRSTMLGVCGRQTPEHHARERQRRIHFVGLHDSTTVGHVVEL